MSENVIILLIGTWFGVFICYLIIQAQKFRLERKHAKFRERMQSLHEDRMTYQQWLLSQLDAIRHSNDDHETSMQKVAELNQRIDQFKKDQLKAIEEAQRIFE